MKNNEPNRFVDKLIIKEYTEKRYRIKGITKKMEDNKNI